MICLKSVKIWTHNSKKQKSYSISKKFFFFTPREWIWPLSHVLLYRRGRKLNSKFTSVGQALDQTLFAECFCSLVSNLLFGESLFSPCRPLSWDLKFDTRFSWVYEKWWFFLNTVSAWSFSYVELQWGPGLINLPKMKSCGFSTLLVFFSKKINNFQDCEL